MPSDDGSRLWLRYDPLRAAAQRYRNVLAGIAMSADTPTRRIIRDELRSALAGLLGREIPVADRPGGEGWLVIQTDAEGGPEGFTLRSSRIDDRRATVLSSTSDRGLLYGAFHLLRLVQTLEPIDELSVTESPRLSRRLLNHWDNLDGSIERGYAGKSLWQWADLPGTLSPRYTDYARACASIGINGTVLNNVNTNPLILTTEYLAKVAALADHWRPYGLRVYLSVNFASPRLIGKLDSNDPLDPRVARWWRDKADEVYKLIPDFGGFLVKANSEGQPGPQDYGRTHADGANVLADALAPHDGIVMYRAFVYNADVDADRVKRAYLEFTRLDGKFRPNVTVQVKNGPLDFMPREPFHPLFGGLKQTPVQAELQVTQEYLGHSNHLVYLGTMWKEFLDADTHCAGAGSIVGKVIDGSARGSAITAMSGVANTGSDANWCGHDFGQANWYAFGRLAWDHELPAEHIAEEWAKMTFTREPRAVDTIVRMMMSSREAIVDYSMPLGLHHLIGGDHYAPMPENDDAPRRDWTATYYHRAAKDGVGYDRTTKGSDAVSQYHPPVRDRLNDSASCPENLLLWFHRVGWDHRLRSGRTLWQGICEKYHSGARQAAELQRTWEALKPHIHPDRHAAVAERLAIQVAHAAQWRDHCLKYFQQFSGQAIPASRKSDSTPGSRG